MTPAQSGIIQSAPGKNNPLFRDTVPAGERIHQERQAVSAYPALVIGTILVGAVSYRRCEESLGRWRAGSTERTGLSK